MPLFPWYVILKQSLSEGFTVIFNAELPESGAKGGGSGRKRGGRKGGGEE